MPRPGVPAWAAVLLGLAVIYVPSFVDLFQGAWAGEKNAHGPIVMVVAFAFLYLRTRQILAQDQWTRQPAPLAGAAIVGFGLLCYVLGRSQSVLVLEIGSLVLVLAGIVALLFGLRVLARMWFAFFFMLFMIPLPPSVVDVVTLPLKIGVSYATEHLLYWMGYPIARSGVILTIGPYQLLVADACAGLNSLFTLEALGLLYMNLVRHPSVVRNAVLAALIIPVSFTANTLRIVTLALITYYFGDAAGQGFLHGFSGLVLFLSALLLIVGLDSALTYLVARRGRGVAATAENSGVQVPALAPGAWRPVVAIPLVPALTLLAAMLVAVALAHRYTPVLSSVAAGTPLEQAVPRQFGDWTEIAPATVQADLSTTDEGKTLSEQVYDQVVMRTYVDAQGDQIMLALAYAREQRQEVKLHLPEICYPAQGYKVLSLTPVPLSVGGGASLPGKHMMASNNGRTEAVTYWTRIGAAYPQGGLAMRGQIFRDGLAGKIDDGILVRASSLVRGDADAPQAYQLQARFLAQLVAATAAPGQLLVATPNP